MTDEPIEVTQELDPCPFCGGADTQADGIITWAVDCRDCLVRGPFADTKAEAITAWNHRINSARPTPVGDGV